MPLFGSLIASSEGDTMGDFVEPATKRLLLANSGGATSENQESGLESVLGGVLISQNSAANAEYHRAVPTNQHRERRPIAASDETAEAFAVGGRSRSVRVRETANVVKQRRGCRVRHGSFSA
jgi:hypothetical protein